MSTLRILEMKNFTIALLLLMVSCPAWAAGPSSIAEYAAMQKAMFQEIEKTAGGITWSDWQFELKQKQKNEDTFYGNFAWKGGRSDFDRLAAGGFCSKVTYNFPGSNIDCFNGSGTWVQGPMRCTFQSFQLIEYQDATEGSLTLYIYYPQQTIKYSDTNGNQITCKILGPNQAQVIEARLPDVADASVDIIPSDIKKNAFNVKSNFLIQLLNDVYSAKWKDKIGIGDFAHNILANPENRRLVIQQATEIYTQPKSKKSK